jgi:hypothetical protein
MEPNTIANTGAVVSPQTLWFPEPQKRRDAMIRSQISLQNPAFQMINGLRAAATIRSDMEEEGLV